MDECQVFIHITANCQHSAFLQSSKKVKKLSLFLVLKAEGCVAVHGGLCPTVPGAMLSTTQSLSGNYSPAQLLVSVLSAWSYFCTVWSF